MSTGQPSLPIVRPMVERTRLRLAALRASWFWDSVLVPFLLTRAAWVLVAAFARSNFEPNPTYARFAQQGGQLTRIFLLDIFAHWDARFYLSIIEQGYWAKTDLGEQYSNVAFYPLYPYLVKSIGWLGIPVPSALYLAIGLILSNALFLAAMVLLHRLAVRHLGINEAATRRGILLLMLYPASFFFSSFYTESLFLFLSLAGFIAALERRWWLAGLAGALAVLTRLPGLLVVAMLVFLYMDGRGWRLGGIRPDLLWFLLAPAALLAHVYQLYRITGSFFALILVQKAWGRAGASMFDRLQAELSPPVFDVSKIDTLLLVLFLGCGIYMLWKFPKVFGLYTILMCLLPLASGSSVSLSRYLVAIFPVFLLLGERLENHSHLFDFFRVLFFTLQILYFAGWVNYYWIA